MILDNIAGKTLSSVLTAFRHEKSGRSMTGIFCMCRRKVMMAPIPLRSHGLRTVSFGRDARYMSTSKIYCGEKSSWTDTSGVKTDLCQRQLTITHVHGYHTERSLPMSPFTFCSQNVLHRNISSRHVNKLLRSLVLNHTLSTSSYLYHKEEIHKEESNDDSSTKDSQLLEAKKKLREAVEDLKEDMLTVPNILTASRIVLTPILGYLVLHGSYSLACGVYIFAGITDLLDGWIARNFANQTSALGSFLDPLADKFLASVLFVTLSMVNLIPVPLAFIVITRDVCLITAAFYVRYITLSPPRTFVRYFNISLASAQLKPTLFSKINTAIQLSLVTFSLAAPVFNFVDCAALQAMWYITATTTIFSGIGYVFAKDTWKIVRNRVKGKSKV